MKVRKEENRSRRARTGRDLSVRRVVSRGSRSRLGPEAKARDSGHPFGRSQADKRII